MKKAKALIYYDYYNGIENLLEGDLETETMEDIIARELPFYNTPDREMIYVVEGWLIDGVWYFPLSWVNYSPTVAEL